MSAVLLIVDIQQDYFPGGAHPCGGAPEALEQAESVLLEWRDRARPVIHVQHVWDEPDATFMRPGTDGVQIHPRVRPHDGEPVITKDSPNAFLGTTLLDELRRLNADELTVMGMMSNMCIDATVRAGSDLGFGMVVIHDACAASSLQFGEVELDAATVHAAFMAALGDGYARLVTAGSAFDA